MSVAVDQKRDDAPPPSLGQVRGLAASARDLMALTPRLVAFNLAYLAAAWIVALGAIAVFWVHPAWYTFALAFVVVSSRQQALLNCEHEAVHRKFLPSRRWNDLAGTFLTAAPVGSPFGAAQARHLSHHRLLATAEDPDAVLHSGEDKSTRRGLARYFISGLLGGYAGMVLMGPRAPQAAATAGTARRDLAALAIVQGLIAVGLTLATAWWVYPALWLAPLATTTALAHLVRSYVEHAITDSETGGHANRLITIKSNWLERAFFSPYNMNYHAEHHLIPSVPAPRLRRLQKRLAGTPDLPPVLERSSYAGAIRHVGGELPHR
jgi:fatty acid desaturase